MKSAVVLMKPKSEFAGGGAETKILPPENPVGVICPEGGYRVNSNTRPEELSVFGQGDVNPKMFTAVAICLLASVRVHHTNICYRPFLCRAVLACQQV